MADDGGFVLMLAQPRTGPRKATAKFWRNPEGGASTGLWVDSVGDATVYKTYREAARHQSLLQGECGGAPVSMETLARAKTKQSRQ